jgi:hypothetical protein
MKYKILAVSWRSTVHTIGFVAYDTQNPAFPGEWNSVVGYKPIMRAYEKDTDKMIFEEITNEDIDTQYIATNGAKIEWNIAKEIFPQLDSRKHKYYHPIKRCYKCNTIKPKEEFYRNKYRYDGISDVCKGCDKKRKRQRKENQNE